MSSMLRAITVLVALAVLAGCGNRTDQGVFLKTARGGGLKKAGQGSAPSQEQLAAAIQGALTATDLPVALAVVEGRNATALLTRIETNGAYQTWGTPDRRTVTTRGGVVTATRGLGNDIMSSTVSDSLALISARKAGSATRIMRYLDGGNATVELVATCQYSKGGTQRISAGELKNVATTKITETCSAGERSFTNTYLVDGRGTPVQSRQWLNPVSGHILLQRLR
ncbi:YjbF family lipoprotein [Rhodobacteraceae bacterium D3-12]|nr:YjbF family lipoprotein [Rhodobacteraceae bacterium D3-12]